MHVKQLPFLIYITHFTASCTLFTEEQNSFISTEHHEERLYMLFIKLKTKNTLNKQQNVFEKYSQNSSFQKGKPFQVHFRVVSNGNQVFQVIFSKQMRNQNQNQNNPNLQGILIETYYRSYFFPHRSYQCLLATYNIFQSDSMMFLALLTQFVQLLFVLLTDSLRKDTLDFRTPPYSYG